MGVPGGVARGVAAIGTGPVSARIANQVSRFRVTETRVWHHPQGDNFWLLHMFLGPNWEWAFWIGKIQGHSALCQDLC